ncbi:MAG: type VI secretion system contractile sheath large subunit [Polyangia bacterium]
MAETQGATTGIIDRLLAAAQLEGKAPTNTLMIRDKFSSVNEDVSTEDRFVSALAAMLFNTESSGRFEKGQVLESVSRIDTLINEQLNEIFHDPTFQNMEATWRGISGLVENTNFSANISIDLLDVSKEELYQDFENNSTDVFNGALFGKVYQTEYDQYGGTPYGCMLGLYEFSSVPRDIFWLRNMSKVAAAAHAPFVSAVSPAFFGCKDIEEVETIRDLDGLLSHPKFGQWQALRDTPEASYLGLCLPRYVVRLPWHPEKNPCPGISFSETTSGERDKYLWGNATLLVARNLVRSFDQSGWCQYIRGPNGGGNINALPVDTFNVRGEEEIRVPVEMIIPDFREFEFTRNGFMVLVYKKGTAEATFFNAQSIKLAKEFKDPKDTENSQLVTNLSYTFSVSRIAHYIKSIVREDIGDNSNDKSIKDKITAWLNQYVTTQVQPNDITMRRFPFKAVDVKVEAKPGRIGFYDCKIAILPHIQFEGMDVELQLESRLG